MSTPESPAFPAGLMKLNHAARLAGISTEIFELAVLGEKIPVEIMVLGPRLKYVRSSELGAWLYGLQKSQAAS